MLVVKAICGAVVLAFVAALLLWVMSGYRSGVAEAVDGGHVRVGDELVRLEGVDALEPDQMCRSGGAAWACGERARAELAQRVAERTVRCRLEGVSEEGERLGVCFVGLEDVAHSLVEAGWALAELDAPERYGGAELQARERLAGIWRSVFTTPEYWRFSHPETPRRRGTSRRVTESAHFDLFAACGWLLGGLVVVRIVWGLRGVFRAGGSPSHRWRIRRAERVQAMLRDIGVRRGPGAQFAYLRRVDPWVVEELVLTALARQGHRIERNERYTGDGGIDGRCWLDGQLNLIQVKRYGGYIAAEDVMGFAAVCRQHQAEGLFIHTGRTGTLASAAAGQPGVRIVSGRKLLELLDVRPRISSEVWMDTQSGGSTQGSGNQELPR